MDIQPNIILASGSVYRKSLVSKLIPNIGTISPDVDETPATTETPTELVSRLAISKAKAGAKKHQLSGLYIGSDQVAIISDSPLSKPETFETAVEQLTQSSGQTVRFLTSLCLYNSRTQKSQLCVESFDVTFKALSQETIRKYLSIEKPYDCAGSFKCEGLGITLFSKMSGEDPNTLIGLPLIRLTEFLANEGVDILDLHSA